MTQFGNGQCSGCSFSLTLTFRNAGEKLRHYRPQKREKQIRPPQLVQILKGGRRILKVLIPPCSKSCKNQPCCACSKRPVKRGLPVWCRICKHGLFVTISCGIARDQLSTAPPRITAGVLCWIIIFYFESNQLLKGWMSRDCNAEKACDSPWDFARTRWWSTCTQGVNA